MSDHYEQWCEAAAAQNAPPITPERLADFFLWTTQHGPANGWTGTSGTAAVIIRELLRERIRLVEELERTREFLCGSSDTEEVEIDVDEL
jgi:hypothetical protein